jgi:hypothetical protein
MREAREMTSRASSLYPRPQGSKQFHRPRKGNVIPPLEDAAATAGMSSVDGFQVPGRAGGGRGLGQSRVAA